MLLTSSMHAGYVDNASCQWYTSLDLHVKSQIVYLVNLWTFTLWAQKHALCLLGCAKFCNEYYVFDLVTLVLTACAALEILISLMSDLVWEAG